MKKILIIAGIAAAGLSITGCGGAQGENPGSAYMPDMYYSRAYEAYGYNNPSAYEGEKNFFYNALPVKGTMARGDVAPFRLPGNDSGYAMSVSLRNPVDTLTATPEILKEADRVYQINCGICHGAALDGNGPLWKGGDGPYPAAPRNLLDDYSKNLSDGQMYHVIMYGKGQMGSYASQLKEAERWWVIRYIREKQGGGKTAGRDTTTAPGMNGSATNNGGGTGGAAAGSGATTTGAAGQTTTSN